jgi:hypothetical protein
MEFAQLVHRQNRAPQYGVPPAPWVPASLFVGPALGTFGLGYAAGLTGSQLLVTPISVALLGVVFAVRRFIERARLRAIADEWIARGWASSAARYGWRLAELTSVGERMVLSKSLRSIVKELTGRRPTVGSIVNRRASHPHRRLLTAIADRLDDVGRPVSAAGMLAVRHLITLPDSPLYARPGLDGRMRDTGAELGAILDRLEVRF